VIDRYVILDTAAGTVVNDGGADEVDVEALPGGWYRVSVTEGNNSSGNTTLRIAVFPSSSASTATLTTGTVWMWGAQVESGVYQSSYIPTTTVAVARSADAVTAAVSDVDFNAVEGTLYVSARVKDTSAMTRFLCAVGDGTASNYVGVYSSTTSIGVGQAYDGGAQQFNMDPGAANAPADYAVAVAWAANDAAVARNGGTPVTDVSVTVPTGLTTFYVGSLNGANFADAHILQMAYFPRRLASTELREITS